MKEKELVAISKRFIQIDKDFEYLKDLVDQLQLNVGSAKDMIINIQDRQRKVDNWINSRPQI